MGECALLGYSGVSPHVRFVFIAICEPNILTLFQKITAECPGRQHGPHVNQFYSLASNLFRPIRSRSREWVTSVLWTAVEIGGGYATC